MRTAVRTDSGGKAEVMELSCLGSDSSDVGYGDEGENALLWRLMEAHALMPEAKGLWLMLNAFLKPALTANAHRVLRSCVA